MLEVRNLHSYYGDAHVLHGVSLEVRPGEVVALLGRNGMGKTTLIRSIMRLAQPQVREGSLLWKGEELKNLTPHEVASRRIALVPQGRRLFASLTVTEHLTMLAGQRERRLDCRSPEMFPGSAENHRQPAAASGRCWPSGAPDARPRLVQWIASEGLALLVQHLETIIADLGKTGVAIFSEQNVYSALSVASRFYVWNRPRCSRSDGGRNQEGSDAANALRRPLTRSFEISAGIEYQGASSTGRDFSPQFQPKFGRSARQPAIINRNNSEGLPAASAPRPNRTGGALHSFLVDQVPQVDLLVIRDINTLRDINAVLGRGGGRRQLLGQECRHKFNFFGGRQGRRIDLGFVGNRLEQASVVRMQRQVQ